MITNRKMIDALYRELGCSVYVIKREAWVLQIPACVDPLGVL